MHRIAFAILLLTFVTSPCLCAPLPHGFLGLNTATWDWDVDTPAVAHLLSDAGITALRFPGGSTSDDFDWTKPQATSVAHFAHLAETLHAVVTITINYGSGSPQMAAAWVAYSNASPSNSFVIGKDDAGRDWKTAGYWASLRAAAPLAQDDGLNVLRAGHPKPWRFRNWEIGNECYGSWENDQHTPKQDASVYARYAVTTMALMKQVDPAIRTGAVLENPGEHYVSQESVNDLVSHQISSEWMPLVFSGLSTHNARPNFFVFHYYPQQPRQEDDAKLLQDPQAWPAIVGGIRSYINAYYPNQSSKIGIACTECNSVSFNPGPQTVSEVNAQYYGKVAAEALKDGCESFFWWDMHDGANHRTGETGFGDYGILSSKQTQDQPYPVYYAIKAFHEAHE